MPVIVIAPWDMQCSLHFSSLPVLSPFLLFLRPFSPSSNSLHSFIQQAFSEPREEQILTRAGETKMNRTPRPLRSWLRSLLVSPLPAVPP